MGPFWPCWWGASSGVEFALGVFPAGNRPRTTFWFGGITVASVLVLPLLWEAQRIGFAGGTVVGAWALASLLVLPPLLSGGTPELFLLLVPYAVAALALLRGGWKGWRDAG